MTIFFVQHIGSSDLWSGSQDPSIKTFNFSFHGFEIVPAVIQDLMNDSIIASPNLKQAKRVLLGGGSAVMFCVFLFF